MPATDKTPAPAFNTDPFEFSIIGGEYIPDSGDGEATHGIASFGSFKAGDLRKVRHLDDVSQMFTLLEKVANDDTLAAIDDLDIPDVAQFFADWQRAAGVSLPS